jgi:hypothetical protein
VAVPSFETEEEAALLLEPKMGVAALMISKLPLESFFPFLEEWCVFLAEWLYGPIISTPRGQIVFIPPYLLSPLVHAGSCLCWCNSISTSGFVEMADYI